MTDDTTETFRVYAHAGKKDESHYELADGLADDDTGDPWDDTLHSELLYIGNEVILTYELDTETDEIELIGVKDGERTLGTPLSEDEVTWNYQFEADRL